jgi:hypothetical protein
MNPTIPGRDADMTPRSFGQPFSRRRLFEFGGATVGLAALLAACGKETEAEPGRVGNAPIPTDLPDLEVNDAVYLRTAQSLEQAVVDVYGVLSGLEGLGEGTVTALARFTDDHTAAVDALGQLVSDNGGEPFACANPWLMERAFQPALDYIVGKAAPERAAGASDSTEASDTTEADDGSIAPTDDADRDTLAMINGLETLVTATYQQTVEKLTTPSLRASVIPFGAAAARRSAVIAIIAGGDEDRFVSPALVGEDLTADADGFIPSYAIPSRFGQLTPIDILIGAKNDLGLRHTATFETPADNAYAYAELTCPA